MRQKWARKVLVNHLFTQTSRQNLVSSRLFYRVHVSHLFSFPYCVYFYFVCLCGVTNGAATVNPSGAPEFTPVFGGLCVAKSLDFCVVFRRAYTMKHIYKYMACRIRMFVRDNNNKSLLHIYHLRTLIQIYTMIIFLPVFIMSSMLSWWSMVYVCNFIWWQYNDLNSIYLQYNNNYLKIAVIRRQMLLLCQYIERYFVWL